MNRSVRYTIFHSVLFLLWSIKLIYFIFQHCQALDTNLEYEKGKFLSTKQEQENYLKLVQGLYARMVRLHSTYCRQNALLHSVYTSLYQQREAEQKLASECAKLKLTESASRTARTNGKTDQEDPNSTPLLKVHLQKSNLDVVLQVGQSIPTPMGSGVITKILPSEQKLVIQLPFGLLYAYLPRAVSWCSTSVDSVDSANTLVQEHSVHGIQQRYQENLHERLTLPAQEVARIQSLIAQSQQSLLTRRISEDEAAQTDNDEASADGSSEMEDGTTSLPGDPMHLTADAAEAEQDASNKPNARRTAEEPSSEVFPMAFESSSLPARAAVRKKIDSEVTDNFAQYLVQTLPLAFAPAGIKV